MSPSYWKKIGNIAVVELEIGNVSGRNENLGIG